MITIKDLVGIALLIFGGLLLASLVSTTLLKLLVGVMFFSAGLKILRNRSYH